MAFSVDVYEYESQTQLRLCTHKPEINTTGLRSRERLKPQKPRNPTLEQNQRDVTQKCNFKK